MPSRRYTVYSLPSRHGGRFGLNSQQRGEEPDGGLRVSGQQLAPPYGAVFVLDTGPLVVLALPEKHRAAAGIADNGRSAKVEHVERAK